MKNLKLSVILLLCLFPVTVFAQNARNQKEIETFWRLQQGDVSSKTVLSYNEIQGTPYLSSAFQSGKIFNGKNKLYGTYTLRYNVYTENFEFRKSCNRILTLNNPAMVWKITLANHTTFIYAPYIEKKHLESGFFQLMNSGKALGLIRYRVGFMPAKPPGAYQEAKPARFSPITKKLYVRFSHRPAVRIDKNSSFVKALPDNKIKVVRFIKKNRIHVTKEKDLLKLLNYYNSL